jgi:para-nitrobenzyl esterase
MHAAWVSFAINGDPGWPTYDLDHRATMRFNTSSQVVDDPRSSEWALWGGVRCTGRSHGTPPTPPNGIGLG